MATAAYILKRDALTKKPRTIIVITLGFCSLTYGIAPCEAALGVTGNGKCYNTRKTCQDPVNYDATTKEYKFSLHSQPSPLPGETVRPYLLSEPTYETTEIDPFGVIKTFRNASARMAFYDEPDNDIGIDPYVSTRSSVSSTFWRKLLARNYYQGRTIEIKRGFEGLDESDYISAKYMIETIKGPGSNKRITINAKDILKKADKVKVPAPTSGKLTGDINDSVTSMIFDDSSEYPAPATDFWVRIGDEIIKCIANNTGTGVITIDPAGRGDLGTTAASHSDGDKAQLVYNKDAVGVWDIMNDLLQNEIGIAAADIDVSGNATEASEWLSAFIFTGNVSKPVTATQLFTELCQQSASYLFWSDDDQQIVLRAIKIPTLDVPSFNEAEHIHGLTVDRNEKSRISRSYLYYNKKTIGDLKKSDSYRSIKISVDLTAESEDVYGEPALFPQYSRWIITDRIASRITDLTLRRFADPAIKLNFMVELKDADVNVGDYIKIDTDKIVDENGANVSGRFYQVLRKKRQSKSAYSMSALDAKINLRYCRISPAGTGDYNSATEDERAVHGWIGSPVDNEVGTLSEDGYNIF